MIYAGGRTLNQKYALLLVGPGRLATKPSFESARNVERNDSCSTRLSVKSLVEIGLLKRCIASRMIFLRLSALDMFPPGSKELDASRCRDGYSHWVEQFKRQFQR